MPVHANAQQSRRLQLRRRTALLSTDRGFSPNHSPESVHRSTTHLTYWVMPMDTSTWQSLIVTISTTALAELPVQAVATVSDACEVAQRSRYRDGRSREYKVHCGAPGSEVLTVAAPTDSSRHRFRRDCRLAPALSDADRSLIYTSVCSAVSSASSTSMPRYCTVLSSFV